MLDWTFLAAHESTHLLTLGHTHALCKALFIRRIFSCHGMLRPFPNESILLLSFFFFFFYPDAQQPSSRIFLLYQGLIKDHQM